MAEEVKPNIREHLGFVIGAKCLDVSQHDLDAIDRSDPCSTFVELTFDNGYSIRFFSRPAEDGPCFMVSHPDGCPCGACGEQEEDE